jgi:hypothetical protein
MRHGAREAPGIELEIQAIGGRKGVSTSRVGGLIERHENVNGTTIFTVGRLAKRGRQPVAMQALRSQVCCGQHPSWQCLCGVVGCAMSMPSCPAMAVEAATACHAWVAARAGIAIPGNTRDTISNRCNATRMAGCDMPPSVSPALTGGPPAIRGFAPSPSQRTMRGSRPTSCKR